MAASDKRALITGVTGQDGMYLSELLIHKGYRVYGLIRGPNDRRPATVEAEIAGVELIEGDLKDLGTLVGALDMSRPDEVYNLAAISFVGLSFEEAEATGEVTGLGALRMLEAVRRLDAGEGRIRYFQASTSELFGNARETPQDELTPFRPRSAYGVAKAYAHHMTVSYRESHGLHASCGILFNHESPRRGHEFVTRKVTSGVARIKLGLQDELIMGNLDSSRDWGFAGDYVEGMWLMLQQDDPGDYVLATGVTHSISDLLDAAFGEVGIDDWRPYVRQDPRFMRPAEVHHVRGDSTKAREVLGWEPKVGFEALIAAMVQNDLAVESANRGRR